MDLCAAANVPDGVPSVQALIVDAKVTANLVVASASKIVIIAMAVTAKGLAIVVEAVVAAIGISDATTDIKGSAMVTKLSIMRL